MVASGLGITVMPATAMTARHVSRLIREVPFAPPVPQRTVVLATRRGFYRPAVSHLLADILRGLPLPITGLSS